jgi:hypothetical protein
MYPGCHSRCSDIALMKQPLSRTLEKLVGRDVLSAVRYGLQCCNGVQFGKVPTFQKNLSAPNVVSKTKASSDYRLLLLVSWTLKMEIRSPSETSGPARSTRHYNPGNRIIYENICIVRYLMSLAFLHYSEEGSSMFVRNVGKLLCRVHGVTRWKTVFLMSNVVPVGTALDSDRMRSAVRRESVSE